MCAAMPASRRAPRRKAACCIIDGNASARCGISLKGADIVVKGSVGHLSAFMAQAGTLIVLGDAGESLGDSHLRGAPLRARRRRQPRRRLRREAAADRHRAELHAKLHGRRAGRARSMSRDFRRYGSARKLYNFHVDNAAAY